MAHFQSTTGRHLVAILIADGWTVEVQRGSVCVLVKQGHSSRAITTNMIIPEVRVRAMCQSIKMTAERFDKLFRDAVVTVETPVTPVVH